MSTNQRACSRGINSTDSLISFVHLSSASIELGSIDSILASGVPKVVLMVSPWLALIRVKHSFHLLLGLHGSIYSFAALCT